MSKDCERRGGQRAQNIQPNANNNNVPQLEPAGSLPINNDLTSPNPITTNTNTQQWNLALTAVTNFTEISGAVYAKAMAVHYIINKQQLFIYGNYTSYDDFVNEGMWYIFY